MNRKIIIGIIVIVVIIIGVTGYFFINNQKSDADNSNANKSIDSSDKLNDNITNTSGEKILVVYYSATGSTKKVAEEIAKNLNSDIFEIEPEEAYTSDDLNWSDSNSRVSKEHDDDSLKNVKLKNTKVSNWDNYDIVLIGYPIWWGVAAWPVNNFVKDNDFTGKTVIPFCTSASSGLGNSGKLLEELAKTGSWLEGQRFSSSASSSDIKVWAESIK